MVFSLWDIATAIVGSVVVAAPVIVVPIPQSTDYYAQTAAHLALAPFSTDPTKTGRVLADESAVPDVKAFIFNNQQCPSSGSELFYRLYVSNEGTAPVKNLIIQFQYPVGSTVATTSSPPTRQDNEKGLLIWEADGLAPLAGYIQFTVTLKGGSSSATSLLVTYLDPANQQRQVVTSHTIQGGCGGLQPTPEAVPENKFPAIICDPAETNCVPFLPSLGIRFDKATPLTVEGGYHSKDIPLGIRANILPGDCRVVGDGTSSIGDDIIFQPLYHDALNRKFDQAAFYMDPLYRSGEDFKNLIQQNTFLGINFIKEIRPKLFALQQKWWNEHVRLAKGVLEGDISPDDAKSQSDALLPNWQKEVKELQKEISTSYDQVQAARRVKLPPVLERAAQNAKLSMQRACGTDSDGGLAALLPPVKEDYELMLNVEVQDLDVGQNDYSSLAPIVQIWAQQFYPALEEYKEGNQGPLKTYVTQQGNFFGRAWELSFDLYYKRYYTDQKRFEGVRKHFEVALDSPKSAATVCEKDKVFQQPVETTFCESSGRYPEVFGPEAIKGSGKNPDAQPPVLITGPRSEINETAVTGLACSGKSGDPWWAEGCQCHCGEQLPAQGLTGFVSCQSVYEITRHDIAIVSRAECLADDKPPHLDPGSRDD